MSYLGPYYFIRTPSPAATRLLAEYSLPWLPEGVRVTPSIAWMQVKPKLEALAAAGEVVEVDSCEGEVKTTGYNWTRL